MEPRSGVKRDIQAQIQNLEDRYGAPVRETVVVRQINRTRGPAGFPISSKRTAEVVLIVPRPAEKVLVHTKSFYPSGVWRLPTGGLWPDETIEHAFLREGMEETGNPLKPVRFLFHLCFRWEGSPKEFQSYGFLTSPAEGPVASRDPHEQITAFRDVGRKEFASVMERLETLAGTWTAWGKFRAAPHRVVLGLWPREGALTAEPLREPPTGLA